MYNWVTLKELELWCGSKKLLLGTAQAHGYQLFLEAHWLLILLASASFMLEEVSYSYHQHKHESSQQDACATSA